MPDPTAPQGMATMVMTQGDPNQLRQLLVQACQSHYFEKWRLCACGRPSKVIFILGICDAHEAVATELRQLTSAAVLPSGAGGLDPRTSIPQGAQPFREASPFSTSATTTMLDEDGVLGGRPIERVRIGAPRAMEPPTQPPPMLQRGPRGPVALTADDLLKLQSAGVDVNLMLRAMAGGDATTPPPPPPPPPPQKPDVYSPIVNDPFRPR